jgi:hypothetical protein
VAKHRSFSAKPRNDFAYSGATDTYAGTFKPSRTQGEMDIAQYMVVKRQLNGPFLTRAATLQTKG